MSYLTLFFSNQNITICTLLCICGIHTGVAAAMQIVADAVGWFYVGLPNRGMIGRFYN